MRTLSCEPYFDLLVETLKRLLVAHAKSCLLVLVRELRLVSCVRLHIVSVLPARFCVNIAALYLDCLEYTCLIQRDQEINSLSYGSVARSVARLS